MTSKKSSSSETDKSGKPAIECKLTANNFYDWKESVSTKLPAIHGRPASFLRKDIAAVTVPYVIPLINEATYSAEAMPGIAHAARQKMLYNEIKERIRPVLQGILFTKCAPYRMRILYKMRILN